MYILFVLFFFLISWTGAHLFEDIFGSNALKIIVLIGGVWLIPVLITGMIGDYLFGEMSCSAEGSGRR